MQKRARRPQHRPASRVMPYEKERGGRRLAMMLNTPEKVGKLPAEFVVDQFESSPHTPCAETGTRSVPATLAAETEPPPRRCRPKPFLGGGLSPGPRAGGVK